MRLFIVKCFPGVSTRVGSVRDVSIVIFILGGGRVRAMRAFAGDTGGNALHREL
jgi:hypothetical protein